MLGLMFMIIGILVITGTYVIYVYVMTNLVNDPLYDATILGIIVPGILLIIFLTFAIISIVKLLRGERWQRIYIGSMGFYLASVIFCYFGTPEPLKDLLYFTTFCFIFSALLMIFGFRSTQKRKPHDNMRI